MRLHALLHEHLLDTSPDPAVDAITELAARLFGTPFAALTLLGGDLVSVLSVFGFDCGKGKRVPAMWTAAQDQPHMILDTSGDPQVLPHPWPAEAPQVRFYAGAPLTTREGERIGTLAVMDSHPRAGDPQKLENLVLLANAVAAQLESRCKALRAIERIEAGSKNAQAALLQSQNHLRAIIDSEPECVKLVAADGTLLDMNPAGLRMIEAPGAMVAVGRPIADFINSADRPAFMDLHKRTLSGESGTLEFRIKGLNGTERWMETHTAPLAQEDGNIFAVLGITRDITSRRRQERWRELETSILELIPSGVPLTELLEHTARAIDATLPGVKSSILLVDERRKTLRHAAAPSLPEEFRRALDGTPYGPEIGSCGAAIARREPVVVSDIQSNPLWGDCRDIAAAHNLRACWSAPVLDAQGNAIAAFALYFHEGKSPTPEELDLLLRLAHLVSIAIERTRKVEETSRSRALLDMASRLSQVGAWEFQLSDSRLIWSEQLCALYGAESGNEPELEDAFALCVPEYRQVFRAAFDACVRNGVPFDLEIEIVTGRNNRIWTRVLGEAVRNSAGGVERLQGAVQDISGRKQAESALRENTWLLQTAGEVAQIGGWALELPSRRVHISSTVLAMLELPQGKPFSLEQAYLRCLPQSREHLLGAIREAAELGISFDVELAIASASGQPRWIKLLGEPERDAAGSIVRIRGAAQDISNRKDAEHALRKGEDRFQMVAKATSDAVWDWDLVKGTVWWSQGIRTLFGYDPEAMPNGVSSWTERIHAEDVGRVILGIRKVIDGTETRWADEYRLRRADGSYAIVSDRAYVIRDEFGRGVRVVGGASDVTAHRQLEEQVRQSQRLEAVGQLTGGVAHDFNNLLTVILGNSELLADNLRHQPKLHKLADTTRKAAEQGAALTHRLLAFARKQALDPRATDINHLVFGMDELLRRTALSAQIELKFHYGPDLWFADIDAAQLENALLNLSLNARDAMRRGGRLTIETANAELDEAYSRNNPGAVPGRYVMVAVSDTGEGMSSEIAARVFEPFFTTKPVGQGSGLGLSMVYGFVKQSKGHVKIYTEVGYGTTVKLYLPRAAGPMPVKHAEVPVEIPVGNEKILLVEDDPLVREYVIDQLASLGYQVVAASDGRDALLELGRHADVDLLFTDVVMPGGLNGPILAEQASALRPDLAVLFTSGYTDNAILHYDRLDRGFHLLQKPYRRQDLALKIRQVLEERFLARRTKS